MMNYMKADLTRIFKRIPHTVLILITLAAFGLAAYIYVFVNNLLADPMLAELGLTGDPNAVFNGITYIAGYAAAMFGLFELIYVFSDDLKAKTAQVAIGVGVSKAKVVVSKFLELAVLLAVDMALVMGLSVAMSGILGSMMTAAQIGELARTLVVDMLAGNLAYSTLVFVLLFSTQSMTLAVLSFLALKFHLVSGLINMTQYVKPLQHLNLGSYTLSTMLGKAGASLALIPVLAVIAYIGASLLATTLIYRKKELEF